MLKCVLLVFMGINKNTFLMLKNLLLCLYLQCLVLKWYGHIYKTRYILSKIILLLIEFIRVMFVNKIIQVSYIQIIIHHLYIVLCVHHPMSNLLHHRLSPFTLFYLPLYPLKTRNTLTQVNRSGIIITKKTMINLLMIPSVKNKNCVLNN